MNDITFNSINGLAKENPFMATMFTILILSLAGIPLTGGFFAKLYMFQSLLTVPYGIPLLIFGVLMAALAIVYYFRILQSMYFKSGEKTQYQFSPFFKSTLFIVVLILIVLGVYPDVLFNLLYFS